MHKVTFEFFTEKEVILDLVAGGLKKTLLAKGVPVMSTVAHQERVPDLAQNVAIPDNKTHTNSTT